MKGQKLHIASQIGDNSVVDNDEINVLLHIHRCWFHAKQTVYTNINIKND